MNENDKVMSKLIKKDEKLDTICLPLLQSLFRAIKELLSKMILEHLPEEQFLDPLPNVLEQTSSAMKHNKLPEFIFGQLDNLLSYRPNASVLANEVYLMYAFNKTNECLKNLSLEEREGQLRIQEKEGGNLGKCLRID